MSAFRRTDLYLIIPWDVEGAGVRWTPLRSRSTDRAGRRDLEPSRPVWAYARAGNKETSRFLIASSINQAGRRSIVCASHGCVVANRFLPLKWVPPICISSRLDVKCSLIQKMRSPIWMTSFFILKERETGLEPATPTLARWCSTN